jgi:hypothetical protein
VQNPIVIIFQFLSRKLRSRLTGLPLLEGGSLCHMQCFLNTSNSATSYIPFQLLDIVHEVLLFHGVFRCRDFLYGTISIILAVHEDDGEANSTPDFELFESIRYFERGGIGTLFHFDTLEVHGLHPSSTGNLHYHF